MAKTMITLTDGGFDEWINELNTAAEEVPAIMLEALKARQEVIEDGIRSQWVLNGGSNGGFVYESIGQSVAYSTQNAKDVVGTVGVYKLDRVNARFGKTDKDLNAAQIAYWVENGTSRLRFGGRKKRGVEYPDELVITTAARPFISNAVYQTWNTAETAFRDKFNEEYAKRVKK